TWICEGVIEGPLQAGEAECYSAVDEDGERVGAGNLAVRRNRREVQRSLAGNRLNTGAQTGQRCRHRWDRGPGIDEISAVSYIGLGARIPHLIDILVVPHRELSERGSGSQNCNSDRTDRIRT